MGFHRRFIPREEIIARLEEYLKQLQAEAKGVEERLAELKKGQE
jgi:DNA anti-recombination protein RmuC